MGSGGRGVAWVGREHLDSASGVYELAPGNGSITFTEVCYDIVIKSVSSNAGEVYWAPGNDYDSARPADNPAALLLEPGEAVGVPSPQQRLRFYNPGSEPVRLVVQGWRS